MSFRRDRVARATIALTAGVTGLALLTVGPATADAPIGSGPLALPSAYTTGDITGDGKIDTHDVEKLERNLGAVAGSPGWPALKAADLTGDGALTVADLAALSQEIIYDDGTFKLVEATALEMQAAMNAGVVTSVELTQAYLDRIAAYDRTVQPGATQPLNSIITTSGAALDEAAASDAARALNGGPRSLLDGIPVVLKDNYDTADMPTTAGCSCWALNQPSSDAFMVKGLRDAHAIILAKASMDEFAINTSSTFSTGSAPGTSLNVYSPYRPTGSSSTSGGSSGGTGASVSANLAALGFGTDTGGSIRVPSSYNQLVGLRPTLGLTSRDGIVPLALSQDVGGPLARSVSDLAIALDAVAGSDTNDPATSSADARRPATYTESLDKDGLRGKRIGFDAAMWTSSNPTVARLFAQLRSDLAAQGATVVPITIPSLSTILGEASGSTNEFNHDLNGYVEKHLNAAVPYRSLTEIANSGGYFVPGRGAPNGTYATRGAVTPATYQTWIASHTAKIADFRGIVTETMDANTLDAVMYPTGTPYGSVGSNLRLSPNTGLPALTLPMGQAAGTEQYAGIGGMNLELLGRSYAEPTLISMAYSYEQATSHRTTPALYGPLAGDVFAGPGADDDPAGDGAVSVTPSVAAVAKGQQFTVTVSQDAADLFAYSLMVGYDARSFSLVSASVDGRGVSDVEKSSGNVSVVNTKIGTSPGSEGQTTLVTLTLKATKAGSTAGVVVSDLDTVDSDGTVVPVR
jgi:Asp-tRNA(Asn)/Glu-tRNA(Gln) amidotransferase A subunit family amidase